MFVIRWLWIPRWKSLENVSVREGPSDPSVSERVSERASERAEPKLQLYCTERDLSECETLEVVGENECPSARGARRPANRDRIGESGVGGVLEVVGGSVSGRADWRLELEDFEVFNWIPFCWRTTKVTSYSCTTA